MNRTAKQFITAVTLLLTAAMSASAQDEGKDWIVLNCDSPGTIATHLQDYLAEKLGRIATQEDFQTVEYLKITGVVGSSNVGNDANFFSYTLGANSALKELDCSDVTSIEGDFSIHDLKQLRRVVQPRATEAFACYSMPELEEVVMGEAPTKLPSDFLYNDPKVKSITIPNTVTELGYCCFEGSGLESVVIPNSVTTVSLRVFNGCKNLSSVTMGTGLTWLRSDMFRGCSKLQQITIPDNVTHIDSNVFYDCDLRTLTIPNSVRKIESSAFSGNHNLTYVKFPDEIDEISGGNHCQGCDSLEQVILPKNLKKIPNYFFDGCTKLSQNSFTLPETCEEIEYWAFGGCKSLTQFAIPSHVRIIGDCAFRGSGLTSFVWPEWISEIPAGCFSKCEQLISITIPETVTKINNEAFSYTALKSIKFPSKLTAIPNYVCQYSSSLTSVTMPTAPTVIGRCAFAYCTSLEHVDLPSSLTTIESFAFQYCPLQEINFPQLVKEYNDYVFEGHKVKNLVVPEGVEIILNGAFSGDSMVTADLPSTLKWFGGNPLGHRRDSLKSVTLRTLVPPEGGTFNFGPWEQTTKIYVPEAGLQKYLQNTTYVNELKAENILPILDGYDPGYMVVCYKDTIKTTSNVGTRKRDVFLTYNTGANWYNVGRLYIDNGATLNMKTFTPVWRNSNVWYQSLSCTFINRGTASADQIRTIYQNDYGAYGAWLFITPPTDIRMKDIVPLYSTTPFMIKRYDSQARAVGNHDKTWVTIGADETLKAGQGYIMRYDATYEKDALGQWNNIDQSNAHIYFNAAASANTYLLRNDDVSLPLQDTRGEFEHNWGWNLIGNPFLAYYDIFYLDSEAPILVREGSYYKAYSPLDDNFVLDPLRAFFVQRTDNLTQLTFGEQGRQQTKDINHAAAARQNSRKAARRAQLHAERTVYDISIAAPSGAEEGTTRLVLNPKATATYDRGMDVPYMSSTIEDPLETEGGTCSLYTISSGLRYCINEQPITATKVKLSYIAIEPGQHTITVSARRDDSEPLFLLDKITGTVQDASEPYTFDTEAGTFENRFLLRIGNGVTAVEHVAVSQQQTENILYDLQGRRISSTNAKGVLISNGKKIIK